MAKAVRHAGGAPIDRSVNPDQKKVVSQRTKECIAAQLRNGHTPLGMTKDEAYLFIDEDGNDDF
ncbi:hypothetical protein N9937_02190 [bacterium]|nr:hypothetical protein [bacterium]